MPISDQKMKKLKVAMVVLLLGFTIILGVIIDRYKTKDEEA